MSTEKMKSKERRFAEFLAERMQISKENKTIYEIISKKFLDIFLQDPKHMYIVATYENKEEVFNISYRINEDILVATKKQEKSSTLNPYRLSIIGNNIRFATLEDLIKHNII